MSVMSPRRYSPQTDNVPTTCQSQDTVGPARFQQRDAPVFWHSDQKFVLAQTARCGLAPAQYQQDTPSGNEQDPSAEGSAAGQRASFATGTAQVQPGRQARANGPQEQQP